MPGLLPATRPLSENYGPDVVDDRPMEDPERELEAANFNAIKSDVAYAARMTPLLKIQISNDGVTAAVVSVVGPEGVLAAQVTATRTGASLVTVDYSGTGVTGTEVTGAGRHASTPLVVMTTKPTAGSVVYVSTVSSSGTPDADFTLWVW